MLNDPNGRKVAKMKRKTIEVCGEKRKVLTIRVGNVEFDVANKYSDTWGKEGLLADLYLNDGDCWLVDAMRVVFGRKKFGIDCVRHEDRFACLRERAKVNGWTLRNKGV